MLYSCFNLKLLYLTLLECQLWLSIIIIYIFTETYIMLILRLSIKIIMNKTIDVETGVPNEVVNLVFDNNYSPAQAWREYLKLSQVEVAQKIGISQSAYSQYEKSQTLRKATRIKIANALGINPDLLDF